MLSNIQIGNIAAINGTAFFFTVVLFFCLFKVNPQRKWLNLLISLLGGTSGWALGNLASPTTKEEQQYFSELATVVATFFSGYLVSKLDRFLEKVLFTENSINQESWVSACFFSSALIISSVTIFLNRYYTLKKT